MPYRKPKETIDLTGWLAPWEADVYRRRIDDLLDLLSRIRKAVHDALPDKTDPLELDAAIEVALRENAELGKRYDELAKMVDRRMGELEAENERLREALEAMNTKLEVESSFEERGETYVAFYRVPAGPWHKILGLIRG